MFVHAKHKIPKVQRKVCDFSCQRAALPSASALVGYCDSQPSNLRVAGAIFRPGGCAWQLQTQENTGCANCAKALEIRRVQTSENSNDFSKTNRFVAFAESL